MIYFSALAAILVLSGTPVFAQQFYEYKDRHGNIIITETPPPGSDRRSGLIHQFKPSNLT